MRHFGQFLQENPFKSEDDRLNPSFWVSDGNGLFLAKILIKNKKWIFGMVASLEMRFDILVLEIYCPYKKTVVIQMDELIEMQEIIPRMDSRFSIVNAKLVKHLKPKTSLHRGDANAHNTQLSRKEDGSCPNQASPLL
ncbi:MAG: hypothetical protein ACNFW9_05530 [Candidatus Kerfeldbacteria bacterium]